MLIGLVGAPNKGKSTLFSAMTLAEADIADYAFTTINPNMGVAYAKKECVEKELGVKCNPRNSLCINGIRQLPVNIMDVAGLVPGAHLGKGMGNQFLNDLANADVLIQVVDITGKTDMNGKQAEYQDPAEEVKMVSDEIARWLAGIISKHSNTISKRGDADKALAELLSGFRASQEQIRKAAERSFLPLSGVAWNDHDILKFSKELLKLIKPTIIAANKCDKASNKDLDGLRNRLPGYTVIGCSAMLELALRKAEKGGAVGISEKGLAIKEGLQKDKKDALEYISRYIKERGSTGVNEILDAAVFSFLSNIVVYPVEDENKYTDHFGNVLPDAILVKNGSTALQLAEKVHTELAKGMKYAVDAKTKMRLARDHVLKDNDVIKIVGPH
ncbi:MAG: YchF-related putative GTPase [Candidatus Micrarchaeota archaeon]|nr:YchF-related putative GTPase [Candidatus Micrarchaeota archaeon]MDE1849381.1 YchF-related putative GTPase [Candidatus Micrarchaeota archaeon]